MAEDRKDTYFNRLLKLGITEGTRDARKAASSWQAIIHDGHSGEIKHIDGLFFDGNVENSIFVPNDPLGIGGQKTVNKGYLLEEALDLETCCELLTLGNTHGYLMEEKVTIEKFEKDQDLESFHDYIDKEAANLRNKYIDATLKTASKQFLRGLKNVGQLSFSRQCKVLAVYRKIAEMLDPDKPLEAIVEECRDIGEKLRETEFDIFAQYHKDEYQALQELRTPKINDLDLHIDLEQLSYLFAYNVVLNQLTKRDLELDELTEAIHIAASKFREKPTVKARSDLLERVGDKFNYSGGRLEGVISVTLDASYDEPEEEEKPFSGKRSEAPTAKNDDDSFRALRKGIIIGLNHPNIILTLKKDVSEGYLVYFEQYIEEMPYEKMQDYNDRIKALMDAGEGIAAFNRVGIIHRDCKPSNILIDKSGKGHIADYDTMKIKGISYKGKKTQAGQSIPCSIHYASPEQISLEETTPGWDVYSFGCTLYTYLTNQSTMSLLSETAQRSLFAAQREKKGNFIEYPAEPFEKYAKEQDWDEDLTKRNREIVKKLTPIMAHCLHPRDMFRYNCVEDVLNDMESVLAGSDPTILNKFLEKENKTLSNYYSDVFCNVPKDAVPKKSGWFKRLFGG